MVTDSRQDSGILAAFEGNGGSAEPLTTTAVADTLDITEDSATARLESLADHGKVDDKQIGESRVWWPVQSVGVRTADDEPEQDRGEDVSEGRAEIRSHPVFDSELVGTIVWGDDLRVRDANDAFLEMAGLDYEEALGTSWEELTPEEFYPASKRHLSEVEESGHGLPYEKQYYHADGSRWWGLFESRQLNDSETVELVVEVTERRKQKDKLEAKQQFIEQSLDALDDIFYVLDTDGTLQRWNGQVPNSLGYTESDLTDANAVEFFPEDEHDTVLEGIETVLSDGDATIEADLLTAAGERRPYEFKGTRLTDTDGHTTGIVGIGRDMSEHVERERELERQNDLFEKAQDIANVGAWEYNPGEQDNYFTDMVYEIYGVDHDHEFESEKDIQEFYHPEDRDAVRTATEEALQSGKEYDIEVRITAADGTDKWVRTRGTPRIEDGTIQSVRGTIQDITEHKEREQEVQTLKTQYQTLVENYPDGAVYLIDSDLRYVRAGGEELDKIGLSSDDITGRKPHALFPEEIADETCHYYEEALDGNANTFEQGYGGEQYRVQTVPIRTGDEETDHLMAVAKNITERKERERELERKTRAIEKAPVGICMTDPSQADNPLVYVNQRFEGMTGYDREDVLGQNCRFLQGEETRSEPVAEIRQGIDDEKPVSVELRNYRNDGTEFWNHLKIAPVEDESGAISSYVGFQQDVTDRKESEQALKKRERILRELHTATREFYPPESETEIDEFLVGFVEKAFGFEYVSVKRFDEETGCLQPTAHSLAVDGVSELGPVAPGANPFWEAYRQGDARIFDGDRISEWQADRSVSVNEVLVVPIGDFGVTVAYTADAGEFDTVDMELIEIVAANAESSYQRLHTDRVRSELVEQLSAQQAQVDELQAIIDTVQTIQHRLANSDTTEALETGVCEELLEAEHVDFAWVGRPRGSNTDLEPTAWAGDGRGYLDTAGPNTDLFVPAQRAVATDGQYASPDIASLVLKEGWAKEALSAGFESVISVPMVHEDVLYGVLTVYSRQKEAFGKIYERLFADAASLLVNYSRLLEQRYDDSHHEYTEIEFEMADPTYPLHRLATEADSPIQFETVTENTETDVRVLVTVAESNVGSVREAVSSVNSITDATQFGDQSRPQILITVRKPFLASVVGKHGGRLVASVSDASETRFLVELPGEASKRPLLDSLSSRYQDIEPVAQRQRGRPRVPSSEQVAELLTDRQYEVLNAAYHGGYYETPRQITGEELAESFGISSPAIYNHLQSAHQTLLERALQPHTGISDESSTLNS